MNNITDSEFKNRNLKIDFIKAIAIIFVVFIHLIANYLITTDMNSFYFFELIFVRSIIAPAVPLFLMCSGYLLFDKKKIIDKSKIFKKYLPRILVALFVFATIYEFINFLYRYKAVNVIEKDSIKAFFENIIFFNHNYHLYYLHIMIIFYLFTPVVKVFINNSKKEDIEYFLILWFVFGIFLFTFFNFKIVNKFSNINNFLLIGMGYSFIFYGILGYYIGNYISERTCKINLFLTCFSVICNCFASYLICIFNGEFNNIFFGGTTVFVFFTAYFLFSFVFSKDLKIYYSKYVIKVSKASFFIYLVHDIFIKIVHLLKFKLFLNPLFDIVVEFIFVFSLSYLSYCLCKRIKFVQKYLV